MAKPIKSLTSGIASPVLREVLAQGTMNSVTGFALGTSFAFASGESFGDALNQGIDGTALAFITGTISGTANGIKEIRNQDFLLKSDTYRSIVQHRIQLLYRALCFFK